jgi:hypothetical protein
VGSHFLFGLVFTPSFVLGVLFVVAAILLYGGAVELPFAAGCCGAARSGADTSLDVSPDAPRADDEEVGLLPSAMGEKKALTSPLLRA